MPEDLCVCVWNCRCTWDELYIPELVTMSACMNACTTVVLCSTVAALCLNLGAPKLDNSHTHHTVHMHGFCTVIVCTIGLHVPIGVMACTQITCLWSMLLQWGYTPLLRAVVTGHTDIARFLLASGSVFNERNSVSARVHVY